MVCATACIGVIFPNDYIDLFSILLGVWAFSSVYNPILHCVLLYSTVNVVLLFSSVVSNYWYFLGEAQTKNSGSEV